MPALDQLEEALGGDSFMVLPLNIDESGITRGREFYNEVGIRHLPLFWAEPLGVQLAFVSLDCRQRCWSTTEETKSVAFRGRSTGMVGGPSISSGMLLDKEKPQQQIDTIGQQCRSV